MNTTELARKLGEIAGSIAGLRDEHEARVARMMRALQEVRSIQGSAETVTREDAENWLRDDQERTYCQPPKWRREAYERARDAFQEWWGGLFKEAP